MGVFRLHFEVFVRDRGIVNRRDDGSGHVFQAFEAVKAGIGLHTDAADFGVKFAKAARDAHECAARAESGNKMRDFAAGLLPDFRAGAVVMSRGIGGIAVLIGIEVTVAVGFVDFAHTANRAVGGFVAWRVNNVHAVGIQNVLSFRRGTRWQAELYFVTEGRADHRVSNAGVAAGGIKNDFAWAEQAAAFAITDH